MNETPPTEKPKIDPNKLRAMIKRVKTGEMPVVSADTEEKLKNTDTQTTEAITDAEAGASAIEAENPPEKPDQA